MPAPVSTGIVVFDYASWVGEFPEFVGVSQPQAQGYFNRSTLILDNTACSIVQDLTQRTALLNLLTAHICQLNAALGGQPSSPLVGRISSATQGSVSVQTQMDVPQGSAQWFNQTKYGAEYWQAVLRFRTARYVPGGPQCIPGAFGNSFIGARWPGRW